MPRMRKPPTSRNSPKQTKNPKKSLNRKKNRKLSTKRDTAPADRSKKHGQQGLYFFVAKESACFGVRKGNYSFLLCVRQSLGLIP